MPEMVTLWRPTGPQELALVEASGWRRWPVRLSEQPIFCPVLTGEYATKIALDWNVSRSGTGAFDQAICGAAGGRGATPERAWLASG
jgi:hypothetical protein